MRIHALPPLLARSYLARFGLSTLAYAGLLLLSWQLIPAGGSGASLVWPPAAFGLVLLLFWGLDLWPAIAVAFFVVLWSRGVSPPLIATTAVANVAEALLGAYLLKQYADFSPMLSRLRDTLSFVCIAVGTSLLSSSIITVGVYVFNQRPALNMTLWVGLWIGHLVSLMSFGPFFVRWLYRPQFTKTGTEVVEGVALFGIITTLSILLFWTPYSSVAGISLLYILIIPLIWAALRTGPRGTTLALFLLATIAATGVLFGYGPISHSANLAQALFGVQMIIGILSLIFLLFTSITEERKEAVLNLELHVDKLEEALQKISSEDQAKSDFIAILAHELRNPLSPLLSGIELLKVEAKASPDVLRMMGAHLNTAARLLDDLLDMSRISQKKLRLHKEPVEMRAVIAHTLEMVQPQFETHNHTFTSSLPQEDVWIEGDPVRLSQIFVNLLTNATKYTDPGGRIHLSLAREGSELVARVRDNGIGIKPERLQRIFEAFGGSEAGEYRPGSLRIGLSLAKRIAEMHDGSITAASEGEGKGAEFTVRLPLPATMPLPINHGARKNRMRGRFSKESSAAMDAQPNLRILVVDDNEAAAQGLGKLLEYYGHTVTLAYDAPEALAAAEASTPQVALLDIGLPSMTGYELARLMRARFGEQVVLIALTGYGQTDDRQKTREAGFVEHLIKPVSVSDVQRVLVEIAERFI